MKFRLLIVLLIVVFSEKVVAQELVTLEEAIALALEENYDIRLAKNLKDVAATDYDYSVGALLPVVTATGAKLWSNNDQRAVFEDTIRQGNNVRANNLSASVALTWTLFDGAKMFATRQRLAEIERQGELNVKSQITNTVAQVIANYYNVVRQKQQLLAILEQSQINEERVKLADRKLEVGIGARPELLQAKVDLNAQRTLALQQETLITQLKDQLNGLTGLKLPAGFDVTDTIVVNLNILPENVLDNFAQSNFDLQAIHKNVDIAYLNLRERRAERFPIINFNSTYTYSKTENATIINPFTTPLNNRNKGYNYGFSITLPIFNGFTTHRLVQQAKINISRQELFYNQQKQAVDVAVRNAYVNYDNTKKILVVEEENISLARENVTIALESFKRGVATFIELRTAQQSLAEAYNRLIAARYNTKVAETELLRLNGSLLK